MMAGSNVRTVYHYTSPHGIFSILSGKSLWFTDVQYLNDKSESISPEKDKLAYVLSTSCCPDSIAMWNYYAKNGVFQGYNLGISVCKFVNILKTDIQSESNKITLKHDSVMYNNEKGLFSKAKAFSSEHEYRFVISTPYDHDFSSTSKFEKKYRVGVSGIITPYLEWKFTLSEKKRLFTEITLSPMIETELALASFERFLPKVYDGITIKSSSIKMRY